ncbi:MAG: hypothetical protein JO307_05865 [Bryobacterales bacterium]|nr:hypothetical protein [Bryobacterales bacterium]MBV9401920.1 hypothetical protein [Bryobacterales bacterium]
MRNSSRSLICTLTLAISLAPFAAAQKPVRKAPTAADWAAMAKLPDFTGVWETAPGGRGGAGRGAGKAGRGAAPAGPSLTPAYAAKAQAPPPRAEENETANCLPPGMPAIMGQPYPIEILMTPGKVTIVIEAYTQVRHIFTDGRALPEDPDPTFFGTSVGHWDGDTLVVETVGFAQVPRGLSFPYSDKMKIVERLKLADPDTLSIETTVVDPEALTQPYSMGARTFKRHRSWTISEYICEENNRNFADQNGKAGIKLAKPGASPR